MDLVADDGFAVTHTYRTQDPQVLLMRDLESHDINQPLE